MMLNMNQRLTPQQIKDKKKNREKITVLTAYDFPTARIMDQCGVDIILVGDSLANVVLGLNSTKDVGMAEMLHHTKAVTRAVKKAMVVADMPFNSYQVQPSSGLKNARRFIKEASADAVKVEWFDECPRVVKDIVKAGIPVMGHVGLTPQTADKLGGLKLQGNDALSAKKIIGQAQMLEKLGCFSVVLECIPQELAKLISQKLSIPTIGIGAGLFCDGQVLVSHDLLGLFDLYRPKFVKQYANVSEVIQKAVSQYCKEVKSGEFPDAAHSFTMKKEELKKLN